MKMESLVVVICNLIKRTDKAIVISKKKLMKHSGMAVVEDLLPENKTLLENERKKPNIEQVWSSNGKIITKDKRRIIAVKRRPALDFIRNYERKKNAHNKIHAPKAQG